MSFKLTSLRIKRNQALLITAPIIGIGLFLSGFYQGTRRVETLENEQLARQYVDNYEAKPGESKGFAITSDVISELNDVIAQDTITPGFQIYYGKNGAKNYMICVPLLPTGKERKAAQDAIDQKFIPIIEVGKVGDLDFAKPCPVTCDKASKVGGN